MVFQVPLGFISVESNGEAIVELRFAEECPEDFHEPDAVERWAEREILEYFAGKRRTFTVPVCARGTWFQCRVWEAVRRIPYGQTVTYGELAQRMGSPRAARAVGTACGSNPVLLLIPCHRVTAQGGRLSGYAGGVWRKQRLLHLEGEAKAQTNDVF